VCELTRPKLGNISGVRSTFHMCFPRP
jgi:hypothetical protein